MKTAVDCLKTLAQYTASPNVNFPIRKETFEPIAAAQSNLFDG